MTDSQIRTIEQLFELTGQPAQTASLNAALRLGVIDLLTAGQKTAAEISQQCRLHETGTLALLRVLQQIGLVEKFGDDYALSQAGRLTPGDLWAVMFRQWTQLESALRIEEPSGDQSTSGKSQNAQKRLEQFRFVQEHIAWAAAGIALKVAEALGAGNERESLRLLDLGCGSAVYSMTIAYRDSGCTVTLVDDERGLQRAKTTVESLQADSRVEMIESGDLSISGLNEAFEMALIADRIHVMDIEERKRVLEMVRQSLVSGGEIVVIDHFPGQTRGELNLSMYELQLLAGTGRSMLSLRDLQAILGESGFSEIQFANLPVAPYTHGLMLASKQ
ncbi:MAG: methyltransferase family protein [Pirellulaceae bacterium]